MRFRPSRICHVRGENPRPFGRSLACTTRLRRLRARMSAGVILRQPRKYATAPSGTSEYSRTKTALSPACDRSVTSCSANGTIQLGLSTMTATVRGLHHQRGEGVISAIHNTELRNDVLAVLMARSFQNSIIGQPRPPRCARRRRHQRAPRRRWTCAASARHRTGNRVGDRQAVRANRYRRGQRRLRLLRRR
jgi:hypothetical protein